MRKVAVIWMGSGIFFLVRGAAGANPTGLLGVIIGISIALCITLVAAGARARIRGVLQLTRLDEQIVSISGQRMPGDLADVRSQDVDLIEGWLMAMEEQSVPEQGFSTRRFEQIEDLPRVEILAEFAR